MRVSRSPSEKVIPGRQMAFIDFRRAAMRHRSPTTPSFWRYAGAGFDGDGRNSPRLVDALRHGLDALCHLVSPTGMLVPYGSLAEYSLDMPRQSWPCAGEQPSFRRRYAADPPCWRHAWPATSVRTGTSPASSTTAAPRSTIGTWYVNNPDYNAYAAAMLFLLTMVAIPAAGGRAAEKPASEITRVGPLLIACRDDSRPSPRRGSRCHSARRSSATTATTRCSRSDRASGRAIAGADALHLAWRRDRQALIDPAVNPGCPYIAAATVTTARRYERVEMREDGDILEVIAEGVPKHIVPVPRWERGARALLGRATGCSHLCFAVRRLDGAHLRRSIAYQHPHRHLPCNHRD